jgi:transcriptional regulator with XRE-family HTH domain
MTISPLERAVDEFAALLARWRTERGLSKRALAAQMAFDPSYVSHVEGRRHRPTEDFARRAENVLDAGGAIWESYIAYEALRQSAPVLPGQRGPGPRPDPEAWSVPGIGLIVEREDAAIGLHQGRYHVVIRRQLHNLGTEPIVRYPVRVEVDRYPNHPRRSARTHHGSPLAWSELGFSARRLAATGPDGAIDPSDPEPMTWRASYEADAVKELWLHFANGDRIFPLYPGHRATIEYAYHVGDNKWGPWFQRAIRMPTRELHVELDFPAETHAALWGTISSLSAESAPLTTPIRVIQDESRMTFTWSVRAPILGARYRFEWRLRE